jgi:hypothetical protein
MNLCILASFQSPVVFHKFYKLKKSQVKLKLTIVALEFGFVCVAPREGGFDALLGDFPNPINILLFQVFIDCFHPV